MSTQKSNQNLIWIDLEITGLDPDKERIIEIATIITDTNLTIVVGDLVEIESSPVNGNSEGLVTKRLDRVTALYKSKEKVKKPIAANISHIGILVTKNPKTNLEFIDY